LSLAAMLLATVDPVFLVRYTCCLAYASAERTLEAHRPGKKGRRDSVANPTRTRSCTRRTMRPPLVLTVSLAMWLPLMLGIAIEYFQYGVSNFGVPYFGQVVAKTSSQGPKSVLTWIQLLCLAVSAIMTGTELLVSVLVLIRHVRYTRTFFRMPEGATDSMADRDAAERSTHVVSRGVVSCYVWVWATRFVLMLLVFFLAGLHIDTAAANAPLLWIVEGGMGVLMMVQVV
jgi:hypothetical protein